MTLTAESVEQPLNNKLIFDISATNIPVLRKYLKCFTTPLLAFYEITNLNNNVLYTSEPHRTSTPEPIWLPSIKIFKRDLHPEF